MSTAKQPPPLAPAALPDPALIAARLDHLFRNSQPGDAANATLRSYIEAYRLQGGKDILP